MDSEEDVQKFENRRAASGPPLDPGASKAAVGIVKNLVRVWHLPPLLAVGGVLWVLVASTPPAVDAEVLLEEVLSTPQVVPNFGTLTAAFAPSIDGEDLLFIGRSISSDSAILVARPGGVVEVLVDTSTPIPGEQGTFGIFASPFVTPSGPTFVGGLTSDSVGIYQLRDAGLTRLVGPGDPIPDGIGAFTHVDNASAFGDEIGFVGFGPMNQSGIYIYDAGSIMRVVDTTTVPLAVPIFRTPTLSADTIAFNVDRSPPIGSNVLQVKEGVLSVVASEVTQLPGPPHGSLRFNNVAANGSRVFFEAHNGLTGFGTPDGIYFTDDGINYGIVANLQTMIPGSVETFRRVSYAIFGDGRVAFVGTGDDSSPPAIYLYADGELSEVVSAAEPLGLFPTSFFELKVGGLQDEKLAFRVRFVGGANALYVATLPEPSGAMAWIAGISAVALLRNRSRKRGVDETTR